MIDAVPLTNPNAWLRQPARPARGGRRPVAAAASPNGVGSGPRVVGINLDWFAAEPLRSQLRQHIAQQRVRSSGLFDGTAVQDELGWVGLAHDPPERCPIKAPTHDRYVLDDDVDVCDLGGMAGEVDDCPCHAPIEGLPPGDGARHGGRT